MASKTLHRCDRCGLQSDDKNAFSTLHETELSRPGRPLKDGARGDLCKERCIPELATWLQTSPEQAANQLEAAAESRAVLLLAERELAAEAAAQRLDESGEAPEPA